MRISVSALAVLTLVTLFACACSPQGSHMQPAAPPPTASGPMEAPPPPDSAPADRAPPPPADPVSVPPSGQQDEPKEPAASAESESASGPEHGLTFGRYYLVVKTVVDDRKMASALPLANPGGALGYSVNINPDYKIPMAPLYRESLSKQLKPHLKLAAKPPSDPQTAELVVTLKRTLVHMKAFVASGPSSGSPTLMFMAIETAAQVEVKSASQARPVASEVIDIASIDARSLGTLTKSSRSLLTFSMPDSAPQYYDIDWSEVLRIEATVVPQLAERIVKMIGPVPTASQ